MTGEPVRAHERPVPAERILVTGASGFLGSHLCRRLINERLEVHAVSRGRRSSEPGICWWQGDMAEISSVRNLFQKVRPGVVFHLSGLATARPDRELVLPTLNSLLVSTVNVLTIGSEIGCRRVVLPASLTEPEANGSEISPGSPYAAAKWASGAYARMFYKLYGLPVVMVRPFMTYGPGQDEHKLIPYVILSLLKGEAPRLSSGEQQFDWIYVDDVTDGFVAAAQADNTESHTVDLGSGRLVSVRSVVDRIAELIGAEARPSFGALADRPLEWARVADTHDAFTRIGWKPRTPVEKGLEQTIEWYRNRLQQTAVSMSGTSRAG